MESRPTSTRGPMWSIAGSAQQLVLALPAGCSGWLAGRSWVASWAAATSGVAAVGVMAVAGATEAMEAMVFRTSTNLVPLSRLVPVNDEASADLV